MIQYRWKIWQVNFYSINIINNTCFGKVGITGTIYLGWWIQPVQQEMNLNLVHAEEEQVMEIGVVSRKKGKLTFANANYSQLRPAGLERIKSREKYLMLEQKSGHPNMSALTVQLSSCGWELVTFATALAKIQGVNYVLNKVLIYKP